MKVDLTPKQIRYIWFTLRQTEVNPNQTPKQIADENEYVRKINNRLAKALGK